MDQIDAIIYINLEHRTDRREHIEAEFKRMGIPAEKVHRINAIRNALGPLGCTMSHIKALKLMEENPAWQRVMVMEDDFTFKGETFSDFNHPLSDFFYKFDKKGWDVFLPSYNHWNAQVSDTVYKQYKKVIYSQTASCYVFKRDYLEKLKANFKASAEGLIRYGKKPEHCLDINWTRLQTEGRWYLITPALGHQYDNYSDNEGRVVRYGC
jgi:GR25 family glycosyltransferase involved in LPS biosynthesis